MLRSPAVPYRGEPLQLSLATRSLVPELLVLPMLPPLPKPCYLLP